MERMEIGFGVEYIAFQKKLASNNVHKPHLYIYIVHMQLEMNVLCCICSCT